MKSRLPRLLAAFIPAFAALAAPVGAAPASKDGSAGKAAREATSPGVVDTGAPDQKRVVLVHGFMDTGNRFKMLQRRLEKQGVVCIAPQLRQRNGRSGRDGSGGLDELAATLKEDIDRKFGKDAKISLIGFSMGGIVSRYYLQALGGAARCENFITISSPHNGTLAAWLYPSKGAEQMRPHSQFLTSLGESDEKLGTIPVTSYRTPLDLIILPAKSSVWNRAENLEYPVLAHPLMVYSDKVLSDIEHRLLDRRDET